MENKCRNCNGTYFVNGKPCPMCNKGTLPPKQPLLENVKDFFKGWWYWLRPW